MKRTGSWPPVLTAQAPRMIGAISAAVAVAPAICRAWKTIGRPWREPAFGERDHLDHALIGLARGLPEGEDAVLVQDQALDVRLLLEHLGGGLGEPEARRDIAHDAHAAVIDLARQGLAVGLIDQGEHGGGMGMVDEFMRQEGMQQRLDRRVWGRRVEQVQPLHVDHGLVGQRIQCTQAPQRLELHGGQPPRLDIGHVGAGALDRDHLMLGAEIVAGARLDRSIAAAMQHEQRIAAEQAGGVDPERDVGADPFRAVSGDRFVGGAVVPLAFHGARCCRDGLSLQALSTHL